MRPARFVLPLAGLLLSAGLGIAPASAALAHKTTTVKFYSQARTGGLYTPAGKPLAANAQPVVGDYLLSADNDYSGTHSKHVSSQTGSDFLHCTITDAKGNASCVGILTLGTSLIYSLSNQNILSQPSGETYVIDGGTGSYAGATGTVVTKDVGKTSNSDFVVTVTTK